jgi:hypothetical protein
MSVYPRLPVYYRPDFRNTYYAIRCPLGRIAAEPPDQARVHLGNIPHRVPYPVANPRLCRQQHGIHVHRDRTVACSAWRKQ